MHAGGVLSSLSILRTPEAWSEISQGYAFFAYPWHFTHTNDRTPAGVRGVRDTLSGCGFQSCRRIPGVRKKRVPLANFLAPLRGAEMSTVQHRSAVRNVQTPNPAPLRGAWCPIPYRRLWPLSADMVAAAAAGVETVGIGNPMISRNASSIRPR